MGWKCSSSFASLLCKCEALSSNPSSHLSPPKKDKYVSRLYYEIIITLILIKLIKIRDKYRQMSLMNVEEKL
jgi:hypothetical protein